MIFYDFYPTSHVFFYPFAKAIFCLTGAHIFNVALNPIHHLYMHFFKTKKTKTKQINYNKLVL